MIRRLGDIKSLSIENIQFHTPEVLDCRFVLSYSSGRIYRSELALQTCNPTWRDLEVTSPTHTSLTHFTVTVLGFPHAPQHCPATASSHAAPMRLLEYSVDLFALTPPHGTLINSLTLEFPDGRFCVPASAESVSRLHAAASTLSAPSSSPSPSRSSSPPTLPPSATAGSSELTPPTSPRALSSSASSSSSSSSSSSAAAAASVIAGSGDGAATPTRQILREKDHRVVHISRALPVLSQLADVHSQCSTAEKDLITAKTRIAQLYEQRRRRRARLEARRVVSEKVAALRAARDTRRAALADAETRLRSTTTRVQAHADATRQFASALRTKRSELKRADRKVSAAKGDLSLAQELLTARRLSLASELRPVYHIYELEAGKMYQIRGAKMPGVRQLQSLEEEEVSTALGYCTHLVALLSKYLEVPLRYYVRFIGSRSLIRDDVISTRVDFPLYSKQADQKHFKIAVTMLQRNVKQLCAAHGLAVSDKQHILCSLMRLYSHLLGGLPMLS